VRMLVMMAAIRQLAALRIAEVVVQLRRAT
jgi:hypothetical protein